MSREQLMRMYQRQIALGGSATGGLFSQASRGALADYRAWRAEYKMQHPGASREEFKEAWRMHKAALGEKPPRGSALVGGARMSKGIRHCMEEKMGPSGRMRCVKFMRGPRAAMLAALGEAAAGSALVGGAPIGGICMSKGLRHCIEEKMGSSGLRRCAKYARGPRGSALVGGVSPGLALYQQFRRDHPGLSRAELSREWKMAKAAMMSRSGAALVGGAKKKAVGAAKLVFAPPVRVGGFLGERALFVEWARANPDARRKDKDCAFYAARKAYQRHFADQGPERAFRAAADILGLSMGMPEKKRRSRKARAPAATPRPSAMAVEEAMEALYPSEAAGPVSAPLVEALGLASQVTPTASLSDQQLEDLLGAAEEEAAQAQDEKKQVIEMAQEGALPSISNEELDQILEGLDFKQAEANAAAQELAAEAEQRGLAPLTPEQIEIQKIKLLRPRQLQMLIKSPGAKIVPRSRRRG